MKITDFLQDVGRPVAYFPKLKRITGSTTATILLCQFIYWRGKESSGDGWFYKTSEEIEEETGLTYNEQKTARKALVEAGLLQEHYARLDHQMTFLVNLDVIDEKWGTAQPNIPESDDSTLGNDGLSQSLNESENTTQITHRKGDILDGMIAFGNQAIERGEDKVEELVTRLEFRLRLNFPRGVKDQAVYRRILNTGKPIDRFIDWVLADEKRAAYAFLYAKDTGSLWRDFPQAFPKSVETEKKSGAFYG